MDTVERRERRSSGSRAVTRRSTQENGVDLEALGQIGSDHRIDLAPVVRFAALSVRVLGFDVVPIKRPAIPADAGLEGLGVTLTLRRLDRADRQAGSTYPMDPKAIVWRRRRRTG